MRYLNRRRNVKRKQADKRPLLGVGALLLAITLLLTTIALAQGPDQTYDLSWWTVDGGGGSSSGGNYALDGTAGQPDPGPVLSGGGYKLEGGFWGGGISGVTVFNTYLPLILRSW
jgi:hypothetical protein